MKIECNRPIEEREKPMVRGVQLYRWAGGSNQLDDGQPEDRPLKREEGGN
jgi:hypothetical protein